MNPPPPSEWKGILGLPDDPTDATLQRLEIDKNMLPIVRRAVPCGVCGAPADRFINRFQCQADPNHVGDLNVGIFTDLTHPDS